MNQVHQHQNRNLILKNNSVNLNSMQIKVTIIIFRIIQIEERL